jgi:NAD-dependent deacetylase
MKVRSTGPGEEVYTLNEDNLILSPGDTCDKGYQLRPHIVWFGEAVPEIEHAAETVTEADILVIIGTSLQVYPAAGLVHYSKPGVPIYLIDPNDVNITSSRVTHLKMKASEGVAELKKLLGVM